MKQRVINNNPETLTKNTNDQKHLTNFANTLKNRLKTDTSDEQTTFRGINFIDYSTNDQEFNNYSKQFFNKQDSPQKVPTQKTFQQTLKNSNTNNRYTSKTS